MKKLLLVSTILLTGAFVVNAQTQKRATLKSSLANKSYPIIKNKTAVDQCTNLNQNTSSGASNAARQTPAAPVVHKSHNPSAASSVPLKVGSTYYDLQSNAAVPRRIINHGDGT